MARKDTRKVQGRVVGLMDGNLLTLMEWMELHEKELTPEQRFQYEMLCGNRRTDTLLLTMNNLLAADAQLQMMNSTTLSNIARAIKAVGKQLYISIPDSGGVHQLQAGTTVIDFVEGTITEPVNGTTNLRTSLKVQNVDEMRSLVISTTAELSISIDGGGFFTLDAGDKLATSDFGFKILYLDSTSGGYIKMMASTTPDLTVMYDRAMAEDLNDFFAPLASTLYDADETVGQSVTLDLTTFGRSIVEAIGTGTVATPFTLSASDDNSHWFTIETEDTASFHHGYENTFRYVRFGSTAGGVPGNKVSLVLKASR